ncbi:MAG: type I-E CRISPR-associated endoribonuclease Cas2e [Saccharofermentanales bacterium]|jgi:CRISPR-associated protein Cas2|nr:type I-E CRISPR-associated endoribonuclease Cas2 [Clostridiaceae bacterium]
MPFTVITLKKSTPSLRGDLTKWMQEIATGVYIGNFNARIREKLWIRITETVGDGEATMSYAYRNEIGYQFVTWNTERENIDCDGIPLVLLPICKEMLHKGEMDFSNASKFRNARKFSGTKPAKKASSIPYIVIDIETDGLDENNHTILELGAVRIDGERRKEFSCLIYYEKKLPDAIVELTGITESMLRETGVPLDDALEQFLNFIGKDILIGYGVDFDIRFINRALERANRQKLKNTCYDLVQYVKREKMFLQDYKLETALKGYGILEKVPHRALQDALLIAQLSTKVNKFQDLMEKKRAF